MPFSASSWHLLAHSDPKMAPKINPKLDHKSKQTDPKIASICNAIFNTIWACFGGKFDDQNGRGNSNIPGSRVQDAHKTAEKPEIVFEISF